MASRIKPDQNWGTRVRTIVGVDPGPDRSAVSVIQFPPAGRPSVVRWMMVPSNPKYFRSIFDDQFIDLVSVERIVLIAGKTSNAIRDTCEVSGAIQWLAIAAGHQVVSPTASEWRRRLCGRSSSRGTPNDQSVAQMLSAWFDHLPPNVHLRDATGVALFGGTFGRR